MDFLKFFRPVLVFLLIFLVGCSKGTVSDVQKKDDSLAENSFGKQLKIVTTTPPLYSLTAKLVKGSQAHISNLVPGNLSEHTYQLTPDDMRQLTDADIVVINGVGLEEFLEPVLAELEGMIVDSSKAVTLLENAADIDHDDTNNEAAEPQEFDENITAEGEIMEVSHADKHGLYDAHIWLAPANAKIQAANILSGLEKVDANNSLLYRQNYAELAVELDALETDIRARLAAIKIEPYIVFHNAYAYFEKEFGIKAAAYLEEFPGKEPSAEYLKELIDVIESSGVKVIFTEPQFFPQLAQTLANDYGLTLETLDPLGQNLTENGYFEMMENNIAALERVLGK